jgi:chaperone LolA
LIALLCVGLITGSTATTWAAKKMSCQDVLNRAKRTFGNITSFRADLTELFYWNLAETSTESQGKMLYRQDDRFRLEFPDQQLVVDGKTLWRYNSETEQLLVEPYNDESGVILPKQLMVGISENWELTNAAEPAAQDSNGYRLELTPLESESAVKHVSIWVNPDNWLVNHAVVDDVQGNRTRYRIDQVEINPTLPDSLFEIHVPKGTETIDLR